MLKSTAQLPPELQAFLQSLDHPLTQAQEQHITQAADALVTTDGRKKSSAPPAEYVLKMVSKDFET